MGDTLGLVFKYLHQHEVTSCMENIIFFFVIKWEYKEFSINQSTSQPRPLHWTFVAFDHRREMVVAEDWWNQSAGVFRNNLVFYKCNHQHVITLVHMRTNMDTIVGMGRGDLTKYKALTETSVTIKNIQHNHIPDCPFEKPELENLSTIAISIPSSRSHTRPAGFFWERTVPRVWRESHNVLLVAHGATLLV